MGAADFGWVLVQFSCSVTSDSLRPRGLPHARLPCPSPAPRACSNSCLLNWWFHPTISFFIVPFSSSFNLSQHQTLHTVMSNSLRPYGLYSPWNYPGQNTGVGILFSSPGDRLSIMVFSNESVLRIRWPKYQNFSISPSNEYSELKSFRIDWFDLFAVQGTLKSLLQHHSSKASILQGSIFLWFNSHIHT